MDADIGRTSPVVLDQEHSRRSLLKTAAWGTAAISAAGIGGFGVATRFADAQVPPNYPTTYQGLGDAAILGFALQLERLEGTFYAQGVDSGFFSGPALAQIAAIRDHEVAHVDALAGTLASLGAPVPPPPQLTFPPDATSSPLRFLGLAATLEPVGIGGKGPRRSGARISSLRRSPSTTWSASTGSRSTSSTRYSRQTTWLSNRACRLGLWSR